MGIHVNLEQGGLAACLECKLLIVDGEEGCVAYATRLIDALKKSLSKTEIEVLDMAYELQHYQYHQLDDEKAAEFLVKLYAYCFDKVFEDTAEVAKAIVEESFFYQRNIDTTVTIDMLEGASEEKRLILLGQYVAEVVDRYADYQDIIENHLEEK